MSGTLLEPASVEVRADAPSSATYFLEVLLVFFFSIASSGRRRRYQPRLLRSVRRGLYPVDHVAAIVVLRVLAYVHLTPWFVGSKSLPDK